MEKTKRCRHNWIPILPSASELNLEGEKKIDYQMDAFFFTNFSDIFLCTHCSSTGHEIKSYRGGIRRHYDGHFLIKAIDIAKKFDLKLPHLMQAEGVINPH